MKAQACPGCRLYQQRTDRATLQQSQIGRVNDWLGVGAQDSGVKKRHVIYMVPPLRTTFMEILAHAEGGMPRSLLTCTHSGSAIAAHVAMTT